MSKTLLSFFDGADLTAADLARLSGRSRSYCSTWCSRAARYGLVRRLGSVADSVTGHKHKLYGHGLKVGEFKRYKLCVYLEHSVLEKIRNSGMTPSKYIRKLVLADNE